MKLSVLLFFATLFSIQANTSYSQEAKLSLNLSNVSIERLLEEIESHSEFRFVYKIRDVDLNRTVSIKARKAELETILDRIFQGTRTGYYIIDQQVFLIQKRMQRLKPVDLLSRSDRFKVQTPAPQDTLSGTITDAEGEPLIGVNVQVKGTNKGTATDFAGRYQLINVDDDAILVFSYIGFQRQEVSVSGSSNIDVTMLTDSELLDEVVVIGYGTQTKGDLTGAVSHVNIDENLTQLPNTSIIESLQGSIPGLNVGITNSPGSNPSLSVRGLNTFSEADEAPLIVLDGVIYRGNLVDLNPNDIESVTVLKDASSTAIYGSQASNGVMLIESRKGKTGKPTIRYSGQYVTGFPSLKHSIVPMKAAENEQFIYDANWEQSRLAPDYLQPNPDFYLPNLWNRKYQIEAYKKWKETGEEYDWYAPFSRNSQKNMHNISLSGRNENLGYFFSSGFDDSKGHILNDDYKRYNFRINLDAEVTDWFTLGVESFYTLSDNSGATADFEQMVITQPWVFPYDEDGNLSPLDPSARARVGNHLIIQENDERKRHNLFGKLSGEFTLLEGLKYRINASYNQRVNFNNHFYPYDSEIAYQSRAFKNNSFFAVSSLDNIVSYHKTFSKAHALDVTLLYGVEELKTSFTEAEGENYINPSLNYNAIEAGDPMRRTIDSGAEKENSIYSMARAMYKLNNKYLFTGTIRRDGFSGFGKNNKFGIFPSVAVGWITSDENFFNVPWMNYLKLRASYGSTGRRGLGRYDTRAVVKEGFDYVFGDGGSSQLGKYINSLANDDLHWETTTGINVGVDYSILNSRIRGNIEYYNNNTNNILYAIQLPETTGFGSINTNIGKVHNHGVELAVTGDVVRSRSFNWESKFSFSRDRNEIESILGFDNDGDGIEDDLVSNQLFIGEPQSVIYGYEIMAQGEMWQLADQEAGTIPVGFYPGMKTSDCELYGPCTSLLIWIRALLLNC